VKEGTFGTLAQELSSLQLTVNQSWFKERRNPQAPGKQSFWDKLGLQNDRALIEDSFAELSQKARFLTSVTPHSGDWLLALPTANCGLRLDDEAVRVAVSMRLGLALCAPHSCPCGGQVDAQGLHAMVCKQAPGRIGRHQVLNDIIWRSLGSASIPATMEPSGLVRQDGKRPDGFTLILWQGGKSLAWDVTVVSTLAQSYVDRGATSAGMVAELAAKRKLEKLHSYSSVCLWHCHDSMQFFCATPLCPRTIRTNSHTSTVFIAFNPWELYTQGIEIVKKLITELQLLAVAITTYCNNEQAPNSPVSKSNII